VDRTNVSRAPFCIERQPLQLVVIQPASLRLSVSSPIKLDKINFSGVTFCEEFEVALPKKVLPVIANHLKSGFYTVN